MLDQNFIVVASKRNHLLPFNRWPFDLTKKSHFSIRIQNLSINQSYLSKKIKNVHNITQNTRN